MGVKRVALLHAFMRMFFWGILSSGLQGYFVQAAIFCMFPPAFPPCVRSFLPPSFTPSLSHTDPSTHTYPPTHQLASAPSPLISPLLTPTGLAISPTASFPPAGTGDKGPPCPRAQSSPLPEDSDGSQGFAAGLCRAR